MCGELVSTIPPGDGALSTLEPTNSGARAYGMFGSTHGTLISEGTRAFGTLSNSVVFIAIPLLLNPLGAGWRFWVTSNVPGYQMATVRMIACYGFKNITI